MIPSANSEVLEAALSELASFGSRTSVRGRFVALYLGFRRMGADLAALDSDDATPASIIETFLDRLFTKIHRAEPFTVLTAPFGQSVSPSAPYSARTGVIAPGRRYATNTWRNNFAIQKGVGCPAEPAVIRGLLEHPLRRLSCPYMAIDEEGRHLCGLAGTAYRGDEHSVWLRMTVDGFQAVDLSLPAVRDEYLRPGGEGIPIFPLIAALYCFAPADVYPVRSRVGIPDFASDFGFSLAEVRDLFDCDPDQEHNAVVLSIAEGTILPRYPTPSGPLREVDAGPLPIPAEPGLINSGIGAELAVAEVLTAAGWTVLYTGNQRGRGYDLLAQRADHQLKVEVKSSVGFTAPELTDAEWQAAQEHGQDYVLAVVDFFGSAQQEIWFLRDPAANATPVQVARVAYRFIRSDIQALGTSAEFL